MDWPARFLTAAVRCLPTERDEWGVAMLAELAQLRHPCTRWQFAFGCACVALSLPRKGGFLMNDGTKRTLLTFSAAALCGVLFVVPFASLELWYTPVIRSWNHFPFMLFGMLWLLPTAFFLTAAPIVRRLRTGGDILAQPITLLLRVAFLTFTVLIWVNLMRDQMPCFLGVPNCD
jgi:hypothetical protein